MVACKWALSWLSKFVSLYRPSCALSKREFYNFLFCSFAASMVFYSMSLSYCISPLSGCSSSLVAASEGSLLEKARRTWFSHQRQVMSKIFSTVLIITCGPLHVCLSHLLQLSRIHSMGLIGLLEWTIQFSISPGMMLLHFVNGVEKDCLQKLNGSMPAGLAYRTSMWTWLRVLVMKFL